MCGLRAAADVLKHLKYKIQIFTARRFATAVLATAIPSVCPSVCPSVTRRYCVKPTARSTVQFAPLDSKMCLETPKNIPQGDPFPLKSSLELTYPS